MSRYVVPRSRATRAAASTTSSPGSISRCAPSTDASRRSASSCSRSSAAGGRSGLETHSRSSSPPRRCAERHARRTIRCERGSGVTSASSRSPTACGAACRRCGRRAGAVSRGRRWASTPSATWRSATSRSAARFSTGRSCSARRARARADRPCPPRSRSIRASRREVDDHDLVGRREHRVGDGLAHAHARELGDLVVEASRCWTLTVENTSMPAASTSSTSSKRLACSTPGRVRVGELVDQASSGARSRTAGRSISSSVDAAVVDAAARDDLEALGLGRRLRAPVRLEVADHHVAPGLRLGLRPPGASGRSCRPRRPCRGRSCGGPASGRRAQAPRMLWTTRSTSLIPMNGTTRPPSP